MRIDDAVAEERPVEIAEGVFWVGYPDSNRGLHCNPYLIVEGGEAVLIDGGNRDDFSNVMLKILRTGLKPSQITRLIYQHYDPDLCGSLPQLEAIINNEELRVISHSENNVFIHYYSSKTEKIDFRELGGHFDFATGRRLEFHPTPYCHQPGSFITYDRKTETLFTSDLFGSYDSRWTLFMELDEACRQCPEAGPCSHEDGTCRIKSVIRFHQRTMTSNRALSNALDVIARLKVRTVAPQHGSIIRDKEDVEAIIRHLRAVRDVGIDGLQTEAPR